MKNINLLTLLLVTLFTLSLSSCGKDGDDDDSTDNVSPNTALLTEGTWTGEGLYVGGTPLKLLLELAGQGDLADALDISSTTFNFEKDGTFTGTADGVADSGKWKFTDNEKKIIITDADNEETTFTILLLNETNLNLELDIAELGLEPEDLEDVPFQKLELRMVKQ